MDINLISLFPELFLTKLVKNNDIGGYFMHINGTRYQHMMSNMMLLLLGNEQITSEIAQVLYEHHSHMKLTRKDYKIFMEVFNETMHELGFAEDQIMNVNLRIKTLVMQLYKIRHNEKTDMIGMLIDTINKTEDLNMLRSRLLFHLDALKELSYNSDMCLLKRQSTLTISDLEDCFVIGE